MSELSPQTLFSLQSKTAVVTGASRGIGRAIAELMGAAGARVVVSSRKLDACEAVAEGIRSRGGQSMAFACNVSKRDEIDALVDASQSHFDGIDVLVLNAAVNPYFGPLLDIDDGAWNKIMDANVACVLHAARRVIPNMASRGGGAMIIISSIAGLKGSHRLGAYAISKVADMQIARNLALEWGHANVRVNCIAPGLVKTDMARVLWDDPENLAKALRAYPLGRIGQPADIAGAALFLASPAGSFVTGQTLVVDGGTTIHSGYS